MGKVAGLQAGLATGLLPCVLSNRRLKLVSGPQGWELPLGGFLFLGPFCFAPFVLTPVPGMRMTTKVPTQTPAPAASSDGAAARLEAFLPLTRAIARRWARRVGWDGAEAEDLAQEAALALWRVLRERPDVPASYLKDAAEHGARDSLERGRSVGRPLPRERERTWRVVSLEALKEDGDGWDAIEAGLIRRRHYGELPSPTEEEALASILYHDLRDRLTLRQRQVLELRLQGYTREEIGARLGLGQTRVNTLLLIIRKKARPLWEEEPAPAPQPAFASTYEAARELGYSHVQVCRFCREGRLPGARRVGKGHRLRWLIPRPVTLAPEAEPTQNLPQIASPRT